MLLSITWTANSAIFHFPEFIPLLGGHEVRWYGLAFILGFYLGFWLLTKVWKNENLNEEWLDKLFFYVFFGTVLGARLGHCFFYAPHYYLANPLEILKVWEGGLASHGGTAGIIIAIYFYSRKVTHKNMMWTFDRLVLPVGFVAAFIRLGNLMNHEIYGHPTDLPWGFRFITNLPYWERGSQAIFSLPSHPTQLYEAFFYILTSCVCLWLYWKKQAYKYQGLIFGIFFIGIFLSRFFVEFLKNDQESFEATWILNMGQILSIPFIIVGCWFAFRGWKKMNNDNYAQTD